MKTATTSPTSSEVVKLSQLIIDPVNVRKTNRGGEPRFARSIAKRGVIQPLTVRRDVKSGFLLVTDGGERLDALQYLRKNKKTARGVLVTDAFEVKVEVEDRSDADARSTSLALNLIRSDMHPVDEFEAFAAMVKDGATLEDIADEYNRKPAEVRQALSLASLAPEIRAAWREGKIDGDAAEAYAQTQDLEHQVRIFKKLKGQAGDEWRGNQEIRGENEHKIGVLLKFVGQKEYEAAGHQVNASLFADDDRQPVMVNNVPALKAMAAKLVEAECVRLKADGWGWAVPKDEAPRDIHAWRRLPAGNPVKETKALAGCTVKIDYNGTLEVERGYLKPGVSVKIEKTKAEKAAARTAGPKNPGLISAALTSRMSEALTTATSTVVTAADPDMVLRLAIAGLLCSSSFSSSPICLKHGGMLSRSKEDDENEYDFAKELAKLAKVGRPALLKQFAALVGMSVDLQSHHVDRRLDGSDDDGEEGAPTALVNFVPQKELQKALLATFNVDDYFENAPGALALAAIADMGLTPLKNVKKAAQAKMAADHAKKRGWLPPQLRTKGYAGPKAKPAPKKAKGKASSRKKRA